MEPAVRSARAQSGIAATLLLGRRLRQQKKVGITAAYLSGFAPTPGRRERNFRLQRQSVEIRHSKTSTLKETRIGELSGRKAPQKRPIWRRLGNMRFAKAGWWR